MISHTVIPNIATVQKWVEIKMDNKNIPPHMFTDLCREFMWLKSAFTDLVLLCNPLFNAINPAVSGLRAAVQ
jgi:hypothetical protein